MSVISIWDQAAIGNQKMAGGKDIVKDWDGIPMLTTSPFTVIEGGGETELNALKPQLVKNEQGQICMQVSLGCYNATLPLPEQMAGATPEQLEEFFAQVVPVMTANLREMAKKDRRKFRKRAQRDA